MGGFIKFLILVLIVGGCVYLYQNQDELLENAKEIAKKEKTINKVNNASAQKQQYIEDAQKQVYGD